MFNPTLREAVEHFARVMLPVAEKNLERPWKWKDHDEEGLRFAFFVTFQELRHLAVTLAGQRSQPSLAQRILAHYHAAYLDLQAAVLGLTDSDADLAPAEGEWPVRRAYAHILGTDFGFTATVRYALELHRAGRWSPDPIPESEYPRLYAISEPEYDQLMAGPLSQLIAYHRGLHETIVQEFAGIPEAELQLPSTFWEETPFPIQHRLQRYEAHFMQHTVQIDKTLVALGLAPTESQRLARRLYAALAEVESQFIGADERAPALLLATAASIAERTREIEDILRTAGG